MEKEVPKLLTDDIIKGAEDFEMMSIQKNRTYWGRTDIADEPLPC